MFKDSLLESSNLARSSNKDKRWSMTLAFVVELIIAAFLLLVPLMSTGVIPLMAHVPLIAPVHSAEVADQTPNNHGSGQRSAAAKATEVVRISNNNAPLLPFGQSRSLVDQPTVMPGEIKNGDGSGTRIGDLITCKSDCTAIARPAGPPTRLRFSHLSEAMLIRKVDPIYPRTALISHVFGAVQLHAIIAKDGSIQSLNVISGSPILVQAALDAVRQWRYQPYMLNEQAVEVETFITVHFRPASN